MGLFDNLLNRRHRALAPRIPVATLPGGGRSSQESLTTITKGLASYLSYWDGVEPALPPSYLDQIARISLVNPDMSQALNNWVALGNPGHDLVITGDENIVQAAHQRINAKAVSLARHTAGIDGLVNKYLEQVALTGAISSEDVVTLGSNPGVEEVVIVPVRQIRFRREGDQYVPYQLPDKGDEIRLNPVTYRYLAFMTIENSPYAKPPMLAALEPILDQHEMKKNIQFIIRKFGLFGLISASVTPPKREVGETVNEYQKRVQDYLSEVLKAFKENFQEGMAVYTSDITVERTNLTSDARGVQEIFRMNEEQVFSGLGSDASMHGRTYSTTETYARVVYDLLQRHVEGFQRPVKRRIERTYQLDLALAGIPVEQVTLHFNRARSQDPLTDARAQDLAWRVLREKVETGLVDPNNAARELGYDGWNDVSRITFAGGAKLKHDPQRRMVAPLERSHRFRFDKFAQRYLYRRPHIDLSTGTIDKRNESPIADGRPDSRETTIEDWLRQDLVAGRQLTETEED